MPEDTRAGGAKISISAVSGGSGEIPVRTTMPTEILRHNISDEEIDVLGNNDRSAFWCFSGVALGSLPVAVERFAQIFTTENGLNLADLFYIIIFVISSAVAMAIFIFSRMKEVGSVKERIRARSGR